MSLIRERSTWWIGVLIALLVLPALALAWMAILSVRDSESLLEQRYEQTLEDGSKIVIDSMNRNLQSVLAQTKTYVEVLQDLENKDLSKPFGVKPPQALSGIFVFQKGRLTYPFWPLMSDRIPSLSWSMDSTEFLSFGRQIRGETPLMLTPKQGSSHEIFARLANLRNQTQQGQSQTVVEQVNQWLPQLSQDSLANEVRPSLWLLRFRSLLASGQYKESRRSIYASVKDFLHRPGDFPLEKVDFIFKEMFDATLSMGDLESKERDSISNLRDNLAYLIAQSQSLQKFRPLLENHVLPFLSTNGIRMLRIDDQVCFVIPQSTVDPSYFVVALFNPAQLDTLLLQGIHSQEASRQLAFSAGPIERPFYHQSITKEMEPFRTIDLGEINPLREIHIYRSPQTVIRKQAQRRSVLLYSILSLAVATILLSIYLAIRTVRNERSVYQLKTNILSSITHELKTPLTSIRMFAETLEGGRYRTQEQAQRYAGMITRESGRLQMLIDDILVYGRLENEGTIERKPVILAELIADVIQRVDPIANVKKIGITFKSEVDATILGDRALLESLFQNLIDNAVKYTMNSGNVELRIFSENQHFVVAVKDTGVGIPQSALPHIFDPFYRVGDELTRKSKGSGIGLAIVRKAVNLHDAKIKVESKEGEGSTFTVWFQREEQHASNSSR